MSEQTYQLLPDLTSEEYNSLKSDIAERGVQVPVEYDEDGNILDGNHRVRACQELGIEDWPSIIRCDMSEDEKMEHILELNLDRRHLTREQRREVVAKLRGEGWSFRRIGKRLDVDAATAYHDWQGATVENSTVDEPERITGADGKSRPARKPATVAKDSREREEATRLLSDVEQKPDGMAAVSDIKRQRTREKKTKKKKTEQKQQQKNPPIISKASWEEWIEDRPECDLLLTDPPYSTDIENIGDFAKWLPVVMQKVKDSGRAYICVGAYPEELHAYMSLNTPFPLQQILVWTYRNTLGPGPKHNYKLNWQAILYYRGPEAPGLDCPQMTEQFSVQDINAPDGRQERRYHKWQKPDDLAERFIRHSTSKGDIVLDPFAGTGSFILAAARLQREAYGCDIDTNMVDIAIERGCENGSAD